MSAYHCSRLFFPFLAASVGGGGGGVFGLTTLVGLRGKLSFSEPAELPLPLEHKLSVIERLRIFILNKRILTRG
jgi:hypothetical protein